MDYINVRPGVYSRNQYVGEITRNFRGETHVEIKLDNEFNVNRKTGKRTPAHRLIARDNILEIGKCG